MNDILAVKIVDRTKHLFDCLGCIFLCEFALLADTVKQLASCRQFRDNVVFVLLQCKHAVYLLLGVQWRSPATQTSPRI